MTSSLTTHHFSMVMWLVFLSISINNSFADDNDQIKDDLKQLQKAEKAGLSTVIKAFGAEGGRFEIQQDGTISITPDDTSTVKKLLPLGFKESLSNKESSTDKKSSTNKKPLINKAPSTKKPSASNTQEEGDNKTKLLTTDSKELLKRLNEANKQGLSALLNKLSVDGGSFELIENGGIKIIPNNSDKAKKLVSITTKAQKIIEEKGIFELSTDSATKAPINTWNKARNISAAWIKEKGISDVYIGKIRHIKWLYITSIVNKNNKMHTQLITRVADGKTISINPDTFEIFNLTLD